MPALWTQFLGCLLVLIGTGSGVYTTAYFSDFEQAPGSVLGATALDATLTGEPFLDAVCSVDDRIDTLLTFSNIGGLPFTYELAFTEVEGAACDGFELQLKRAGEIAYTGSIAGAYVEVTESLPVGHADVWEVILRYQDEQVPLDSSCSFRTVFTASQAPWLQGTAFYDIESLTHSVSVIKPTAGSIGDVTINTENDATITNTASSSASTGGNSTTGGVHAGESSDDTSVGSGNVTTGDATTNTTIENTVNETSTIVEGCGCSTCGCAIETADNPVQSTEESAGTTEASETEVAAESSASDESTETLSDTETETETETENESEDEDVETDTAPGPEGDNEPRTRDGEQRSTRTSE